MSNQNEYGVFKRVGEFGEVGSHFVYEPGVKPLPPDSQAATFHRLLEEHGSLAFLLSDPPPVYLALIGRVVEDDDFTDFIVGMHYGGPGCHPMIDTLASCGYTLIRVSYLPHDNDKEITEDD